MALTFHQIPGSKLYEVQKNGEPIIWSKALVAEALSSKDCKIDARDSTGGTMLLFATATGDIELIQNLIFNKASLRAVDNKGRDVNMHILRALSMEKDIAKYKKLEIFSGFFIEKLLNVIVDKEGKSLLSYAVEARSVYWADIVLKRMMWQFEGEESLVYMQDALDIAVKIRYVPAISVLFKYADLEVSHLISDEGTDYLNTALKFQCAGNRKQAKKLLTELEEKYFSRPIELAEPEIDKFPVIVEVGAIPHGPPVSTEFVAVPEYLFDF